MIDINQPIKGTMEKKIKIPFYKDYGFYLIIGLSTILISIGILGISYMIINSGILK